MPCRWSEVQSKSKSSHHDKLVYSNHKGRTCHQGSSYSHALLRFQVIVRVATCEQVCSWIKGVDMQVRRVPGTALALDRTGEIIYTPPVGEPLLRNLLANWERFLHDATALDPLIRLAVADYQFEVIHPFTDVNGRPGRVLNSLFLIQDNLLTLPISYLSRYIIGHKQDYYRLFLEATRHACHKS